MAGGRPPKPTALKRLAGNPGKRPLNEREAQPRALGGYCPRWLSAAARAEWRRVSGELQACGLLTVVDRAALEAYCQLYARWREAEAVVKREGLTFVAPSGFVMQRPEVGIAAASLKLMRGYMTEFGMTPSSRSRVTTVKPTEEKSLIEMLEDAIVVGDDSE